MNRTSTSHRAEWARKKERSNMLMLKLMTWISLTFGRRVSRIILHLIASYFLAFAPSSRRASREYLQRALGRPATVYDLYRHFFTFAATIHDRTYLINQRFELFDIDVVGAELIHTHLAKGNGLFLAGAHLGSFEVIRSLGKDKDLRVAMFMHEENAKKINAMLTAINPDASRDIIGLGNVESMLQVNQKLADGYAIGILADRIFTDDAVHPVKILGDMVNLPLGPFRLAALLNQKVMFMTGLYLGDNRYSIHFHQLADFTDVKRNQRDSAVKDAMLEYANLIDYYCRAAPYNWFNFFDFWQTSTTNSD